MSKKKDAKTERKQPTDDDNLLAAPSNELKILVTDGTVAIHSGHGLVNIRNGSLTISSAYASPDFGVAIASGAFTASPTENMFSIKDGVLNALPSANIVLQPQSEDSLFMLGDGDLRTSALRNGIFDIRSQSIFPVSEQNLTIREAAFTVSPLSKPLLGDDSHLKSLTVDNSFTIKDGVFSLSARSKSLLAEGAKTILNSINENTLTIRNGTLIPSLNTDLLTGGNSFLKLDAIDGTLSVKDKPFRLTTDYTSASQVVLQTQKTLSGIDWLHAGNGLGIDILDRSRIQESFLGLSNSYSDLFLKTVGVQPAICSLPKSVAAISSIEYLHSANVISQTTYIDPTLGLLPEEYVADDLHAGAHKELLAQLGKMDSGLETMFQGAVYALNSSNPDKVRHFSTSLRELFTHVLHRLSPDNEVRRWSKSKEDFDHGKPTRRARLLYICREINQDYFEKFLNADVNALLEFLNLFQGGTHSIKPEYTEKQMKAMLMRMESTLRFLIEVTRV